MILNKNLTLGVFEKTVKLFVVDCY